MEPKEVKLHVINNPHLTTKQKLAQLSSGKWLITQEILQDVQAAAIIEAKGVASNIPSLTQQIESLKEAINIQFTDNIELRDFLLESLPSNQTIWRWTKTKGWDSSVMEKVKSIHVFSPVNKTSMLTALYEKGLLKGDVRAMELYFKLSGDLVPADKAQRSKEEEKQKEDIYDTFNNALRKAK